MDVLLAGLFYCFIIYFEYMYLFLTPGTGMPSLRASANRYTPSWGMPKARSFLKFKDNIFYFNVLNGKMEVLARTLRNVIVNLYPDHFVKKE